MRREIARQGGQKPCLRIVRNLYTATADQVGVIAHRRGALERVAWVLADWETDKQRLAATEDRMVAVLDELELTALVTSIHGISAVGAAAILAESGDPRRFPTGRALVKHAGLAPRQRQSGTYTGQTRLTGRGRPRLRVAAWRAVWGALGTNTVYANRYRHLTTRDTNRLKPTQAQTVIAAALSCGSSTPWSPPAKPGTPTSQPAVPTTTTSPSPPDQPSTSRPPRADDRGEPYAATRKRTSAHIMGSPVRRRHNPITRCRAQPHSAMQEGRRTGHRPNA
ncbi:MAG: IS110 family transposase [Nocardioides sp.]